MGGDRHFHSRTTCIHLDAHLGGWLSGEDRYTTAFARAADALVRAARSEGGSAPDAYFYPVCLLYRQAIEIALKVNVRDAETLLDRDPSDFSSTHDLASILAQLEEALKELPVDPLPAEVRRALMELAKVDPNGQRFRYAMRRRTDRSLAPSFPVTQHVNLDELAAKLHDAHALLWYGLGSVLGNMLDARSEALAQLRER